MRFWYVAKRRQTVLDGTILTLFGVALLCILLWLLPREDQFKSLLGRDQTDLVALRYAQLMVQRDPGNSELQYLLGKQYANLGRFRDAIAQLGKIDRLARSPRAKFLLLDVLQRLYFGNATENEKRIWRQNIEYTLGDLSAVTTLTSGQRRELAAIAAGFGVPALAAEQYAWLARNGDPNALIDAGKFALASGRPRQAAKFYREALLANPRGRELWETALAAYSGANLLEEGAILIRDVLAAGNFNPDTIIVAGRFLQAADRPNILRKLIHQSADMPLGAKDLEQWMKMAIAVGELELGVTRIQELLVALPNKASVRLQAAQVYSWTNRADDGLEHWEWLASNAEHLADKESTWRLAQVLWRNDVVINMLTDLADDRQLKAQEREALIKAYLKVGSPDLAVALYAKHLENNSEDIAAWRRGAAILTSDEQFDLALAWYQQMSKHVELDSIDHMQVAQLYWRQFRLDEALKEFNAVDDELLDDPANYWTWVARLAWELGDYERANEALIAYADISELDKTQFDMLLASLGNGQMDLRRHFALEAWRVLADPRYLLTALLDAYEQDDEQFESLLAIAMKNLAAFENSPTFWILKARHHQRHGEQDLAWLAFAKASTLSPSDPVTVASVLWFLIDEKRTKLLTSYLHSKRELAEQAGELAHPFGAGYALLNKPRQAKYWYERAVALEPDSPNIALAFADALSASGSVDAGWRMRKHVLELALTQGYALTELDASVITRASLGLLTQPTSGRALLALLEQDKQGVLNGLMNNLLNSGHLEGMRSIRALAKGQGVKVDPYIEYYIAVQEQDRDALEAYRDHASPTIRVEALLALGDESAALFEALNGLTDEQAQLYRSQLRRVATDMLHEDPYGIQLFAEQLNLGGIDLAADHLRFARPWRNWHLDSRLTRRTFDTEEALGIRSEFDERIAQVHAERSVADGDWTLSGLVAQSTTDDWLGVKFQRRWNIDRRLQTRASLGFGQLAEQTPLLRVFGKLNELNLGITHRLTPVDVLSANLDVNQFNDRFGDRIGQGLELELNYEHTLFSNAPSFRLMTNGYWMRNKREAFGRPLTNLLSGRNPNDVLPLDTGRLSFGAVIERGNPMRLSRRVPSPHYRVGISSGIQWPTGNTTLNIEASLGIRILGDDLLALRFAYESQPLAVAGDSGINWSLVYNRRLGK